MNIDPFCYNHVALHLMLITEENLTMITVYHSKIKSNLILRLHNECRRSKNDPQLFSLQYKV